jgi:glutamine cyclotransferase
MSKVQSRFGERRKAQPSPRATNRHYVWLSLGVLAAVIVAFVLSHESVTNPEPAAVDSPLRTVATTGTAEQVLALPAVLSGATPPLTATIPLTLTAAPTTVPTSTAAVTPTATPLAEIPRYTYQVIQVYPHDPTAFTQGLAFDGETLYEGTGLNGRSSLRRVDLVTGAVVQQANLAEDYFGEGITVFGPRIYQLTWQSRVGFVYEKSTFALLREFSYPTEGWGITHDGTRLIMSDGTARLYFWDPETLAEIGSVDVYDSQGPVTRLNELEFVQGELLANIWQSDRIARIDPTTGQVTGWIDLSGLLSPAERASADVLNGIAYQSTTNRLFVTGKLWPKLFEIELVLVE